MIIVDTNVLSELTRLSPAKVVLDWMDQQDPDTVFITAITKAELLFGLACLPEGRRKLDLAEKYATLFSDHFNSNVFPFDANSAVVFADIAARAIKLGRGYSTEDLQIASIALSNSSCIATRNVQDFDHIGLQVINPWAD